MMETDLPRPLPTPHVRRARRRPGTSAQLTLFGAVAAVLALGAALSPAQDGGAGLPARDDAVLAEVPARQGAEGQLLARLRTEAALAPRDLSRALALARAHLEAARREGDPRELGAAEAALASWTNSADPPAEVRLLRATLLQARHAFEAALVDLDRALTALPDDAQGWLTRATIWTVKGGYEQARASCAELARLASQGIVAGCAAPIDARTGQSARARARLERAIAESRAPVERAWLLSLLGEQAFWLDQHADAERALRASLALDPSDRYTRALFADLLLELGRAHEARRLVAAHARDDGLALRLALAELAAGNPTADAQVARLARAFEASQLRGDAVHRREQARLWLARGDAERALAAALDSWAVQREPWDARLVLEAALAARRPGRAADVLAWLEASQFEAPRLRGLASQLRAER